MPLPDPRADPSLAFPYLRYSSNPQEDGDSLRRQTALYQGWLKRHPRIRLDDSLQLIDRAVSAFGAAHRTDPKHALARFLDQVKRQRVPAGSYLLIENLDRLTRENPIASIPAILSLIAAGIRIVQLAPEVIYDRDLDQGKLFVLVAELSRAHGESKRKSDLVGPAWQEKKRQARADKTPYGRAIPAWLELKEGTYRLRPGAARTLRLLFRWAAEGLGSRTIAERLREEGHPVIAPCRQRRHPGKRLIRWGEAWSRAYVEKLLRDRRLLGEYQPGKGTGRREPDGAPIPGYFPAALTEGEWFAAQSSRAARRRTCGRPAPTGTPDNPFAGLLWSALDRCKLHVLTRTDNGAAGQLRKFLTSARAQEGERRAQGTSFPLEAFTEELLAQLQELRAAELFADPGAARLEEIKGRLEDNAQLKERAVIEFEATRSPTWSALVTKYCEREQALLREQQQARQRAAHPLSATWAEAMTLARREEPARFRAALLQTVASVWCLFVARNRTAARLAMVQVWFHGAPAQHRDYVIVYEPRVTNNGRRRPARWRSGSLAGVALPQDLDLRKPDQARRLYDRLLAQAEWRID